MFVCFSLTRYGSLNRCIICHHFFRLSRLSRLMLISGAIRKIFQRLSKEWIALPRNWWSYPVFVLCMLAKGLRALYRQIFSNPLVGGVRPWVSGFVEGGARLFRALFEPMPNSIEDDFLCFMFCVTSCYHAAERAKNKLAFLERHLR